MRPLMYGAFAGALAGIACVDGNAQEYPAKPVRILVGFAAGGGTDIMARAVG